MDGRRRGPGCAVWLLLAVVLLGAIAGGLGWIYVKKYMPTSELADKSQIFGVSGDQVALILDNELQEEQGIYADGQVYLPVEWVNSPSQPEILLGCRGRASGLTPFRTRLYTRMRPQRERAAPSFG